MRPLCGRITPGRTRTIFEIVGRYDRLISALELALQDEQVKLMLNSPVTQISWQRGQARVQTQSPGGKRTSPHEARAVVITLPLGVLQARRVKFSPPLPQKQALIRKLGWGHVVRIVLCFRTGFWSAPFMPPALGARNGRNFGFVNSPGLPLPVWWALNPPAPILTGWAGGDGSRSLRHQSPAGVRNAALASLAAIFGTTMSKLRPWLADWQCHQWSADPFSLGSYSFPVAGLERGARDLARPVSSTLFFGGEATAKDYGTVHGAFESGIRAAGEVNAALKSGAPFFNSSHPG